MHEFMPLKPFLVLSQWTCQIHYFRSKTHVLGGSRPFRSRTWHVAKTGIKAHLMHEFVPLEPFHVCLQQTCPLHYFRSKTQVLDGFVPFCCRTRPTAKISIGVHLKHEFVPQKPFLVWSQRTCSIHNFRSKNHVYNSAWYSMHFYIAFDDN